MRIKKHQNKNEYALAGDVWVRDMTKKGVSQIDINDLSTVKDYDIFAKNESHNRRKKYPSIDSNSLIHENVVIVSDGYDFKSKHQALLETEKDVAVIAINGSLSKWDLMSGENRKLISYYVINNPYSEATIYLPKNRYYPMCIASTRSNPEFLEEYRGDIYTYQPTSNEYYAGLKKRSSSSIDDYRNPLCAAIGIAYKFSVQNLLLFCCDNSFNHQRATAIPTHDGLWKYPQHELSEKIVDANLYWLKKSGVQIGDHSSGTKYDHAQYISLEGIPKFFKGEDE